MVKEEVILERLDNLIEQNKIDHEEIIKHQKHTNGDVTSLKMWRAGITGSVAVIIFIFGYIATIFYMDRQDQKQKNETVIRLEEQVGQISLKLNDLELVK